MANKIIFTVVSGLKDLYTICLERTNEVKRHLAKEGNFGRVQSKAAETILYLFAVAAVSDHLALSATM